MAVSGRSGSSHEMTLTSPSRVTVVTMRLFAVTNWAGVIVTPEVLEELDEDELELDELDEDELDEDELDEDELDEDELDEDELVGTW